MTTDVLVIGGGPAGLAAAFEVARRGYQLTLVDSASALGGQLRQQTQRIDALPTPFAGLRGFELAEQLSARLRALPVRCLLEHEVTGLYADGTVGIFDGKEIFGIVPRCVIVATGAAESAIAFPGWTLPGIMTVGAAQVLVNRERILPGKRTVVVGSSDMGLEIAAQMQAVGIEVLAVVESGDRIRATAAAPASFEHTALPILLETEVVSASGRGKVQEIALRRAGRDGKEQLLPVDFVCLDGGRHPIPEVLSVLGCAFTYREALGGWLPSYGSDLQTSVEGIFVAGQSAGITCHGGIVLTGALAGIAAAEYLEWTAPRQTEADWRCCWAELERIEASVVPDVWQARLSHIAAAPPQNRRAACTGKGVCHG